jgi:hypothetical protein
MEEDISSQRQKVMEEDISSQIQKLMEEVISNQRQKSDGGKIKGETESR